LLNVGGSHNLNKSVAPRLHCAVQFFDKGSSSVHPIVATVIQRLFLGIATLFVVSIIIFSSIEMLPGDFGQAVLGQAATEETVAAFRKELGLDKPAYIRYFDWVAGVIQGDLGTVLFWARCIRCGTVHVLLPN
jgi:ABC-type microcin C transport system permease subunit YejB